MIRGFSFGGCEASKFNLDFKEHNANLSVLIECCSNLVRYQTRKFTTSYLGFTSQAWIIITSCLLKRAPHQWVTVRRASAYRSRVRRKDHDRAAYRKHVGITMCVSFTLRVESAQSASRRS